jgi:hypothetical protein
MVNLKKQAFYDSINIPFERIFLTKHGGCNKETVDKQAGNKKLRAS